MRSLFAPRTTRPDRSPRGRFASRPQFDRLEDRTLLSFGLGSALGVDGSVGQAIATDAAGSVYVAGAFTGIVDFDQDPSTASTAGSVGTNDGFVAKYVPNATVAGGMSLAWVQTVGSPGCGVSPNAVALDGAGNVYLTGRLHSDTAAVSTYNFGASSVTTTSTDEAFVAKYGADGTNGWAARMGGGYASGLATFRNAGGRDFLYVAGRAWAGTPTYGPAGTPLGVTVPGGANYLFAWNLDVTGATASSLPSNAWFRAVGSTDIYNRATAVAVDSTGNAYLTGCFSGKVDFDPGPGSFSLTAYGGMDAFLWKLTATGNHVWAGQLGGSNNDVGNAIALDAAANVYVTGNFNSSSSWKQGSSTNDFDPGKNKAQLATYTTGNTFIAKYDTNRNYLWAKSIGAEWTLGLGLDGAANVYTTGGFSGTVDFDPGSGVRNLSSGTTGPSIFVTKLTSAGQYADAAQFVMRAAWDFTPAARGYAIALDGSGNVYTTGDFTGTVDFDPTSGEYLLNSPSTNGVAFISRLTQSAGTFAPAKATSAPMIRALPTLISLGTVPGAALVDLVVASGQSRDGRLLSFGRPRSRNASLGMTSERA